MQILGGSMMSMRPRRGSPHRCLLYLVLLCAIVQRYCNGWSPNPPSQSIDTTETTVSSQYRRLVFRSFLHSVPTIFCGLGTAQVARASNLPSSTGADTSKVGTVEKLIPLVRLRQSLSNIQSDLLIAESGDNDKKSTTRNIDKYTIPTTEMEFKRLFDEFSDPVSYKQKFLDQNAFLVYYTKGFDGPNRPNIEDDINERQTKQFGLRNEVWLSWDDFLVELKFIDDDDNDATKYLQKSIQAMDSYLSLAPSKDLETAKNECKVSW